MIRKSTRKQRASRRVPINLRNQPSCRPFEQVVQTATTTSAGTASTSITFTVSGLSNDLSGASPSRKLQMRRLHVMLPPFNVLSTTTTVTPMVSAQLAYISQANATVSTPMTRPIFLNNTTRTTLRFSLPRDVSEHINSSSGNTVAQLNFYNTAGAASVAYTIPVVIRVIWDLYEDSLV